MSELHQQIEQWLDWAQMDQAEFRRRLVSNTQQSKSLTARVNDGGPLTPAEQKQIEQYGNDSIGLLFVSMLLQSKRMDRKKGELTEDPAYSDYDVKLALIKAFNMSYTQAEKLEGDDLENAIDAVLKSRNKRDSEDPILKLGRRFQQEFPELKLPAIAQKIYDSLSPGEQQGWLKKAYEHHEHCGLFYDEYKCSHINELAVRMIKVKFKNLIQKAKRQDKKPDK